MFNYLGGLPNADSYIFHGNHACYLGFQHLPMTTILMVQYIHFNI